MNTTETFEELLAPLPDEVQKLATLIRECISDELPEADENVYGRQKMGMTLYSIDNPNSVICGIQPTETMCKLFFHGWQEFKRRGYKLEGSGKNARRIKLRTLSDFDSKTIREMLNVVKVELTSK